MIISCYINFPGGIYLRLRGQITALLAALIKAFIGLGLLPYVYYKRVLPIMRLKTNVPWSTYTYIFHIFWDGKSYGVGHSLTWVAHCVYYNTWKKK